MFSQCKQDIDETVHCRLPRYPACRWNPPNLLQDVWVVFFVEYTTHEADFDGLEVWQTAEDRLEDIDITGINVKFLHKLF